MIPENLEKMVGGVLIATRADLEINAKVISSKCAAEILSIQLDFPNGRKIVLCTFYRVGTLGQDNFGRVESYLQTVFRRRGINEVILVGDLNLAHTNWSLAESSCNIEQSFIDLFDDLSFSQVIKEKTHIKRKTLDVLVSTRPENIINLEVWLLIAFMVDILKHLHTGDTNHFIFLSRYRFLLGNSL